MNSEESVQERRDRLEKDIEHLIKAQVNAEYMDFEDLPKHLNSPYYQVRVIVKRRLRTGE